MYLFYLLMFYINIYTKFQMKYFGFHVVKFPIRMYCMSNKVSVGKVIQWTEEIPDTTVWSSFKS